MDKKYLKKLMTAVAKGQISEKKALQLIGNKKKVAPRKPKQALLKGNKKGSKVNTHKSKKQLNDREKK